MIMKGHPTLNRSRVLLLDAVYYYMKNIFCGGEVAPFCKGYIQPSEFTEVEQKWQQPKN